MSFDLVRHPVARALLVSPPEWRRTVRFVATAWLLAASGIWAAQQLHTGSHETLELTPMIHLLRDTALAVPMAAIAIAAGGLLATEIVHGWRLDPSGAGSRVVWAVAAAAVFAVLSIPGQEVHGLLFGVEPETGDWRTDVGLDTGVLLLASLVVLVPAALLGLTPWAPGAAAEAGPLPTPPLSAARPSRGPVSDPVHEQGVTRDA